jgi:hypothetical protein
MTELGMITPDQLAVVLEAKRESGLPLGQIIVELGFASGPAVAHALAVQSGGALRTEYGYALGLPARAEPRGERQEGPGGVAEGAQPNELPKLRLARSARPVAARTESEPPKRTIEEEAEPSRPQRQLLKPDELLEEVAEVGSASAKIRNSAQAASGSRRIERVNPAAPARTEAERERGMAEVERLQTAVADLREALREALERLAASREAVVERDRAVAEVERLQRELAETGGQAAAAAAFAAERDRLAAGLDEVRQALAEARERLAAVEAEGVARAGEIVCLQDERDRVVGEAERLQTLLDEARSEGAAEAFATQEERGRLSARLDQTQEALREALERLAASREAVVERDRAVAEVERLQTEARKLGEMERALKKARTRLAASAAAAEERDRALAEVERLESVADAWREWLAHAPAANLAKPAPATEREKVRKSWNRDDLESSEEPSSAGQTTLRPEEREHTLLVPSANGYALVQRNGSPPSAGETLELPVGESGELARFTVARVGRSLLPDKSICVYLLSD